MGYVGFSTDPIKFYVTVESEGLNHSTKVTGQSDS